MILILEIVFLITGAVALITGRMSGWMFGGSQFVALGPRARLLGLWLMLPLPAAFVFGVVLTLLVGEPATWLAVAAELVIVVVVGAGAIWGFRQIREPIPPPPGGTVLTSAGQPAEALIERKANGAMLYAVSSILGVPAVVFGPLAFVYASQAIRLIEQHQVGQQFRGRALAARAIAAVVCAAWAAIAACFVLSLVISTT